ncbi:MAG: AAA-like domain-containing protein [Hydrococcus sp. Prado102]|jgi:hypothetical protein|nr:AAA-like domain-containing protein [Hydrococcus sp. Prado102]
MKPEHWDKFLEDMANSFELKGKYREAFSIRFAYENWYKNDEEVWQLAQATSIESYKKQMTDVYKQFAISSNGCPNLTQGIKGAGKFEKLRVWLKEIQHPLWLNRLAPQPLDSPFYVELLPVELECYQALLQPGAFVRIKAPPQMGKTLLLDRVLAQLRTKGYQTLHFNFGLEDSEIFTSYSQFSQSFCAGISQLLDLPDRLDDYWSENLGSNRNTTKYFEKYFLTERTSPLILALNRVDRVFEHETIALDFCRLLRGWYDRARQSDRRGGIWQQLRLVVVHSTDVYSSLNINSSPLAGVGKVFLLPEFSPQQLKDLAQRYQLNLTDEQIEELMNLIGGHPYLVRQAFDYLKVKQVSWQEFLQISCTESSPFSDCLRQLLWTLQQQPSLAKAFFEVVTSKQPISLSSECGFKLQSMGLVNLDGDKYYPKCNLYRQYFSVHLEEVNR